MPSPPVVIYSTDFSAYPTGVPPSDWITNIARVEPDPLGFYNHVLQMGADHAVKDLNHLYTSATVYFGFCVNSQTPNPFLYSFVNSPPVEDNSTIRIADLKIEPDFTLSCVGFGNVLLQNTGLANGVINPFGWNFVQVNITITTYNRISDGALCIALSMDLGLNGATMFTQALKETDLQVASLYYPTGAFNWWYFNSPGLEGGPIGDVFLAQLTEINLFPFNFAGGIYQKSKSNLFASQGFHEVVEIPTTSNLRASQGFIEVSELPLIQKVPLKEFPNLRVTQGFIELMTENLSPPPPSQGGHVYES